jgi:hypothetical protein
MENNARVRMAGTLYTAGGALWLVWILGWSLLGGGIPVAASQYFALSQIIFIIIQILLFIGFLGVWWSRGVGDGTFGKIAFGLGLLGHFIFILAEIYSLATGSEDLLPVAALTSALGFILTGIAILRANRWHGWGRYTPLLVGLYFFVGMFPFVVILNQPSFIAVGLWGLFRLLLGLAMREQVRMAAPSEGASHLYSAKSA